MSAARRQKCQSSFLASSFVVVVVDLRPPDSPSVPALAAAASAVAAPVAVAAPAAAAPGEAALAIVDDEDAAVQPLAQLHPLPSFPVSSCS